MNLKRGDVVLVYYPFTSGAGGKNRPALVVQSDARNGLGPDYVLAMITGQSHRAAGDSANILIEDSSPEFPASGLLRTSVIKCGHLMTIEGTLVRRVIGRFPPDIMERVGSCIKSALDLP
jgi:mRNA interferase MazF